MKPTSTLGLAVAAGTLAAAVLALGPPAPVRVALPDGPDPRPGRAGAPRVLARMTPRRAGEARTSRGQASDEARDRLERIVTGLARRLADGDCDARFDAHARSAADALIERHGLPENDALAPYLKDPDTTAAAAVLAGHLGWTELPPAALAALAALSNDARLEGAGEGFPEADAAFARALAVTPARMRFEGPAGRDALLGALTDPSPPRRRLGRVAAASAEPLDAVRRLARLAVHLDGTGTRTSRLGFALRQCLDRVPEPAAVDPATLAIVRERARAWSSPSLTRALARFPDR